MMQYVLICLDHPDHQALRAETRPAHLAYMDAHPVRYAGPLLATDEATPIGSIIVVEAEDRASAETIAEGDPYRLAGLFASVTIHPFRQVVPAE